MLRSHTRFRALPVVVLLAFQVAAASWAVAVPGDLDLSFGVGGKVMTDFGTGEPTDDFANGAAMQPDGKIVVAGTVFGEQEDRFAVARYNRDGSLDPSFGVAGRVTTYLGGEVRVRGMALQPDGKIIVAGFVFPLEDDADFAMVRYNADGSPDTTFGNNGQVVTDLGSERDFAEAVAVHPNGRIVLAGSTIVEETGLQWALAAYTRDGTLDGSFGTGGIVVTDTDPFGEALAVAVRPDGSVVAAGWAAGNFSVARYSRDGVLDPAFGVGGQASADFGGIDVASSLALQSDGKVVVAGSSFSPQNWDFILARFRVDGVLDSTFGVGGKVTTGFGGTEEVANAVAVGRDGRIVAAGQAGDAQNLTTAAFAVARYNRDGSLDGSFGSGGTVTTDFAGSIDIAEAVIVPPSGQVIAVGGAVTLGGVDFALAAWATR